MHTISRREIMAGVAALGAPGLAFAAPASALLNASYDPTREFYKSFNLLFAGDWKRRTGQEVRINQSHDGSGK
ncbi:MAG: sulfate transporter subunit, partial [Caulobacteraceae bacterium]